MMKPTVARATLPERRLPRGESVGSEEDDEPVFVEGAALLGLIEVKRVDRARFVLNAFKLVK